MAKPIPVRAFVLELAVYTPLVALYLVGMLASVKGVVFYIFQAQPRWVYALLALCLMLGQTLALDILTGWLLKLFGKRKGR